MQKKRSWQKDEKKDERVEQHGPVARVPFEPSRFPGSTRRPLWVIEAEASTSIKEALTHGVGRSLGPGSTA
jgi:hypothetical protein